LNKNILQDDIGNMFVVDVGNMLVVDVGNMLVVDVGNMLVLDSGNMLVEALNFRIKILVLCDPPPIFDLVIDLKNL
jgi:hypothetical protein